MADVALPFVRSSSPARLSHAYLLVAGVVILASGALPGVPLVRDLIYPAVGLSAIAAIVIGIHRHRPPTRAAWYLMATAQGLWILADVAANSGQRLSPNGLPALTDLFYLLGYPTFVVGLVLLIKVRARRDLGPLLDGVTATAGLGLVAWVILTGGNLGTIHHTAVTSALAPTYPVLDIFLLGPLIRMISAPGGRTAAFRFVLAALTLLGTADTLSVTLGLHPTSTLSVADYLWLCSYVCLGTAALHPSMTALSGPLGMPDLRFRGRRLTTVVLATMIAPAILAVHQITGLRIDLWAVIIGSVAIVLMAVVRMNVAISEIAGAHTALEVLQDELAVQATHDPLTRLANRTQSLRLVAGALGRARRRDSSIGLLFIDLDEFKAVNDNHGHRAGDEVLRQVARRMQAEIRDGDFVGRLGGDEFLLGIEDVTDEGDAVALANRLIAAISKEIRIEDGLTVHVGASVGIALARGGTTDVETLLHEADLAVYHAKASGRGRVELFNGQARAALKERNDMERALVQAMARDELVVHYQPIVHLQSGRVECYEALVRWNRPGVGLLSPGEFLPFAETSDLICDIDAWVLTAAVAQLNQWNHERGDYALQIAVNISGRHISQSRIRDEIAVALRSGAVIPPQLVIEVTETVPMDEISGTANLEVLRAMGVVISLDDFGTGYQSTAQLSRLPIDMLKIDRQFVDTSTATSRGLLELMVKTAHAFGLRVVAEGIEGQDQLDLVRELGCEYVQGFYIGYPTPADELPGFEVDRLAVS